ncbi:exocyst complex component 7-like protein [Trifolium pratense]|uniref:Exocyst subunit Exo70 family protein n=1 Tax=Trifolium pratense TaxID=57577 RepID=A0A2K3PF12_TRIPR|nr:exocyst complex component 7-like protein [Trifolium pratense]
MMDMVPPETMNKLHEMAKLMVNTGFEKECYNVYSSCRRECVAAANRSRSPDWLFTILDVFEILWDLIPEFESLFCDQFCVSLRNETNTTLKKLAKAIVEIFMELENVIRQDLAKAAVPEGGIHPIIRYTMKYLCLICDYRPTPEQVWTYVEGIPEA